MTELLPWEEAPVTPTRAEILAQLADDLGVTYPEGTRLQDVVDELPATDVVDACCHAIRTVNEHPRYINEYASLIWGEDAGGALLAGDPLPALAPYLALR